MDAGGGAAEPPRVCRHRPRMTTTESGITVGMPVWNAMPWLPEAMESLFHQTTEAFEILVIADSSTDGSTEYLRTLRDHRLRVVEQAMSGGGEPWEAVACFRSERDRDRQLGERVRERRRGGAGAQAPKPPPRRPTAASQAKQQAVVELREEHPEHGTRRIRDVLARFEGMGVSETQVREILHEAGLIEPREPTAAREHGPRRFERAAPNPMWQSDIFTFLLRRHERRFGGTVCRRQKLGGVLNFYERKAA